MKYIDCHTHTHFATYENDWREVIDRALSQNVALINVGTQKDTSARAVEVAHLFPANVYAAIGLHPIHTQPSYHDAQELGGGEAAAAFTPLENALPKARLQPPRGDFSLTAFTSRGEEFDFDYYHKLAVDEKVVAIGECGLDYYRLEDHTKEIQKKAFLAQVELSHAVKKPLMIHCRNAFPDLIEILTSQSSLLNPTPGVVHFFTGTKENARKLLELGFSFTFGGVITFARDYDDVIRLIPIDRILSETDAPYVAPVPYRGRRNEPAYVVETVKKLAELKGVEEEVMARQIMENARRVFGVK